MSPARGLWLQILPCSTQRTPRRRPSCSSCCLSLPSNPFVPFNSCFADDPPVQGPPLPCPHPHPLLSPPLITSLSLTTTLRPNTTLLRHTHHAETSSLRANYYYALISRRRTRLPHGSGSQLSPLQASCIPPSTTAPLNRARRSPPDILVTTPTRRPRATTTSPSPRAALHPATLL
jgi:hypothetical protein